MTHAVKLAVAMAGALMLASVAGAQAQEGVEQQVQQRTEQQIRKQGSEAIGKGDMQRRRDRIHQPESASGRSQGAGKGGRKGGGGR